MSVTNDVYFGTWDPQESPLLPQPENVDFAAYYILNDGQVGSQLYLKDTWLIYFCESRGTAAERENWAISNGLLCFNKDSSINTPDPGFYTKIRLDNNGNIVDGGTLEVEDIPKEIIQKIDIISDDNIKKIATEVASTIFQNETNNPLQFNWDPNLKKHSAELKLDETTIGINDFGELSVIGFDSVLGGGSGDCANHTHSADQIKGLDDFVKDILVNFAIKNTLQSALADLVDEETIILNSSGRLSAVSMKVGIHSHRMDDILDLNQQIANVWASNQSLHKYKNEQDFTDGYFNLEGRPIGDIFILFNQLALNYYNRLNSLEKKIGTVEPVEPNRIDSAKFIIDSQPISVIDTATKKTVEAYSKIKVTTDDIIYQDGSDLIAYFDSQEIATIECYDNSLTGSVFTEKTEGPWTITYHGDAYPKEKGYQGYYQGFKFSFDHNDPTVEEGEHQLQFKTVNVNTKEETFSEIILIRIYRQVKASSILNLKEQTIEENLVSGIKSHQQVKFVFEPQAVSYKKRYAPIYSSFIEDNLNNHFELSPLDYQSGTIHFNPIEIELPSNFEGQYRIIMKSFNILNMPGTDSEFLSDYIHRNSSQYESYRVAFSQNSSKVIDGVYRVYQLEPWSSARDLSSGQFINEMIFFNDSAIIDKTDWTKNQLGPDYSNKPDIQEFILRFNLPVPINNFYFDLLNKDNQIFEWNNWHQLKNIEIYAAISNNLTVDRWIDCNQFYSGKGNWSEKNLYPGLDLFRTTEERKWVTLGQRPSDNHGYLYLYIKSNQGLNLEALIRSLEESIHTF